MIKFLRDFFIAPPAPKAPVRMQHRHRPAIGFGARKRDPLEMAAQTYGYDTVGWGDQFEALRWTDERTTVPYYFRQLALRSAVSSFSRQMIAGLSSYLYDNSGAVGYAVTQLADYSVPVVPYAASDDPEANKLYDLYFREWTKRADFTGRFDYWWLQTMQIILAVLHGDVGRVFTMAGGFPQIQLVECWRICGTGSRTTVDETDGVSIDAMGRVQGYLLDGGDKFIPSNQMRLFMYPERMTRYRGLSLLRRGMNDVRDRSDIKGFTKLAAKIRAALCAVIEGAPVEPDTLGNDTGQPNDYDPVGGNITEGGNESALGAGAMGTPQQKKFSLLELLGGDIPMLPCGQTLHQLENDGPAPNMMDLLSFLAGEMVAGLGIPPAFFVDQHGTGPNQRAMNGKAQRRFDRWSQLMANEVEWDWLRVIGFGIANDELPTPKGISFDKAELQAFLDGQGPRPIDLMTWARIEMQGPPKISIDDGRDSQSNRDDFNVGLNSRQRIFGQRQQNWKREMDQNMAEDDYIIDRCKTRADVTGVPLEVYLARAGIIQPKAVSALETAAEQDGEGEPDEDDQNKPAPPAKPVPPPKPPAPKPPPPRRPAPATK